MKTLNLSKTQVFADLAESKRNEKVPKTVLFECGKLLASAWVSFAISQRIGFTLDDVAVLRFNKF